MSRNQRFARDATSAVSGAPAGRNTAHAYNVMRPITVTVASMLLTIGVFGLVGILL